MKEAVEATDAKQKTCINHDSDCDSSDDENFVGDPLKEKTKRKIKNLIRLKKAKFNFATLAILKSLFCCSTLKSRASLRKTVWGRKVMNFKRGEEKIDKEMDLANILLKIR